MKYPTEPGHYWRWDGHDWYVVRIDRDPEGWAGNDSEPWIAWEVGWDQPEDTWADGAECPDWHRFIKIPEPERPQPTPP